MYIILVRSYSNTIWINYKECSFVNIFDHRGLNQNIDDITTYKSIISRACT